MPKKKLFYSIFIACEGENSEPNYLGRLVETIDEDRRVSVSIFPKPKFVHEKPEGNETGRRSDPIGLVQEAIRKLDDGYDEAWAVFDKNGHVGHAEAFKQAAEGVNGKKVNIAFSSISFEQWVLLHFEQNTTAFPKAKNLIEERFMEKGAGFFPNYSKNRNSDIYPILQNRTLLAIENAAWLRQQLANDLINANGKVFKINPFTNADELVKFLLGIPYNFTWAYYGEDTIFKGCSLLVHLENQRFAIKLSNVSNATLVLNSHNLSDYFFLNDTNTSLQLLQTLRIDPNETALFHLVSNEKLHQHVRLSFQIGGDRLVFGQQSTFR